MGKLTKRWCGGGESGGSLVLAFRLWITLHINHISKVEFLRAFRAAIFTSFREDNIKAGFRGAGLVPLSP